MPPVRLAVFISVGAQNREAVLGLLEQLTKASQAEPGVVRYQYYLHPTD